MKKIILSSLFAISVLSLSACQSQAAYVERPMPTEKLVNNQLPDIPEALLKPIPISNMKSPTGKDDFTKFFKWMSDTNSTFMPNFEEQLLSSCEKFCGDFDKKNIKMVIEDYKQNVWNQSEKEVKQLTELKAKVKDKEVKAIIQYLIDVYHFSMDSWAKMANTYIKPEKPSADEFRLFKETNIEFERKAQPIKDIFLNAISKFMKKYEEK
jgi:lipoprotein